ncbi:MAG: serine/threonine-protein kinase [Polyangiaceae bacterium]|nr:serine/threonine-protein kinase [Polyangiaceae bacterium]
MGRPEGSGVDCPSEEAFITPGSRGGSECATLLLKMKCESCSNDNVLGARYCATCGALLPVETSHNDDPLIGKLLGGRFRVRRVLGEGGMGVVYEGEQQMGSTVRKVAIKTLHLHLSKDPSIMARFHRECGTVAQLEHPNTIKFYDFGTTDDGALYIAMEFVDGHALSAVIEKEGALRPDRVIKIMRQVCGALDEAHQQGIIHRDLKPENVVLTNRAGETDFVKVLDFGIAGRTESADAAKEQKLTQQGMVLGTPPYMSPEQFTGKALDARSDIYSLGVMTYEMITGRLPFDATTPWEWATQHMTVQPRPLEATPAAQKLPENMRSAIMRALSKDPAHRPDTARQFFAELSGGERMTVVDPGVAAQAISGTAQMDAVPSFPSGVNFAPSANVAAPPAVAVPGYAAAPGGGVPGYSGARIPAATPPAVSHAHPGTPERGGSGKGLIFGLVGVAGVILVAIVMILARSSKPDDQQLSLVDPNAATGSKGGGAELKPMVDPNEATPTPPPDAPQPTAATGKPANTSKPPPASTGKTPPSASSAPSAPATTTAPTTATPPPASDGCAACVAAASSGNLQGAAVGFARCSDAGKKQACQAAAREQLRPALSSGDCTKTKAVVAAATAMGLGGSLLAKAAAACP